MSAKAPSMPAATEVPTANDPAVEEARLKAQKAALLRKGRASTILTDQQNLGEAPVIKKSLLGQ